jgi:hypothetical protein
MSITIANISITNPTGQLFTTANGSFNANDNNINLTFLPDSTTVSDTANSGYSLTILNNFQGLINNTPALTDSATLTGTIELTTPPLPSVINNPNPTFAISGYLSCANYSVYADPNKTHLSLSIVLNLAPFINTIIPSSTYLGVVNFTVSITAKNSITTGGQNESVTLTSATGPINTIYLDITDIINNASSQILSSINNSVNQLTKLIQGILPPKLNIRV